MPSTKIYDEYEVPSTFSRYWRSFKSNNLNYLCFWATIFLTIIIIFAPELTPHAPAAQQPHFLLPPAWERLGQLSYFFGTDDVGRDVLSRLILGCRQTLGTAFIITLIAAFLGTIIGTIAGMSKGLISSGLTHCCDSFLSIPTILLGILFISLLEMSHFAIILAVGLTIMPFYIRTITAKVKEIVEKDFIMAARLDGGSGLNLLLHSILPNLTNTFFNQTIRAVNLSILSIASFGFLGLGVDANSCEWGAMLGDSTHLIYLAPWTVIAPGLALSLSTIIINIVFNGMRTSVIQEVD